MARLGQKSKQYRSRYLTRTRSRQRYTNTSGLRAASNTYLGITTARGSVQGVAGPPGPAGQAASAFKISVTYDTEAALLADLTNDHGIFAMVAGTLAESNADYGKVYYWVNANNLSGWNFVADMSVRGIAGESVLDGAGVPANTLGKNGDKYFDKTNKTLYPSKVNGVWPLPVSLKGDTGDPGTQGGTWSGDIDMDSNQITNVGNLEIDDLKIDGNTISNTVLNGDINIAANGSGKLKVGETVEMDAGIIDKVDNITFEMDPTGIDFGGSSAVFKKCLDEDDMASDSNESVATQQSIKAYVDDKTQKYDHLMILPSDWMPSDASSTYNIGIYDFNSGWDTYGSLRAMSSFLELFAYKELPKGYKATSIDIWMNHKLATDSTTIEVYEKFWNNTAPSSKGSLAMTGTAGSALYQLDFTDITATGSNMIMLRIDPANTIAKFLGAKIYITEV